jgi:translation elongation factor EF-Tu-like GTPase
MDTLKILATLTFYPEKVIGKKRIFYNKYRPAFKIREDMFNSGEIVFIDKIEVITGDTNVDAIITFLHGNLLTEFIYKGKKFTFAEGSKFFGEGIVLEILK